jgi:hypothetical protein
LAHPLMVAAPQMPTKQRDSLGEVHPHRPLERGEIIQRTLGKQIKRCPERLPASERLGFVPEPGTTVLTK